MKLKGHLIQLTGILLLPFRVIYLLGVKPILLFFLEKEIKKERDKYKNLLRNYREVKSELLKAEDLKRLQRDKTDRLKKVINHYQNYDVEFDKTENDEVVIIFTPRHKELDSFYLFGMDGKDLTNDCRIYLSKFCNELKILDIISNTKNMGYAKALLNYTIRKAKVNGIERIYGELSPVDKDSFEWLIPFYESLGFTCTLSKYKDMGGYIELNIFRKQNNYT